MSVSVDFRYAETFQFLEEKPAKNSFEIEIRALIQDTTLSDQLEKLYQERTEEENQFWLTLFGAIKKLDLFADAPHQQFQTLGELRMFYQGRLRSKSITKISG